MRKQFKVPIADFGGIKEALARATSNSLICIAGGDLMNVGGDVNNLFWPPSLRSFATDSFAAVQERLRSEVADARRGLLTTRALDDEGP
jgi:hypothetical protein